MTRSTSVMSERGHQDTLHPWSSRPASAAKSMTSLVTDVTQEVSRPGSPVRSDSAVSEFLGGRRMETLLQALDSDRKAGDVIRKFLAHTDNQVC